MEESMEGPRGHEQEWKCHVEWACCLGRPQRWGRVYRMSLYQGSYFAIWDSSEVQYPNEITAHDHLLSVSDQRLDTCTSWKPGWVPNIGRCCSPTTHYLGVPSCHWASHNSLYFLLLTSHLTCECSMNRTMLCCHSLMFPPCIRLGNISLLFKFKVCKRPVRVAQRSDMKEVCWLWFQIISNTWISTEKRGQYIKSRAYLTISW